MYKILFFLYFLFYFFQRYAYGEMDRKNFLRGMVKGYEDESIRRKQEEDLRVKYINIIYNREKKNQKKKEEDQLIYMKEIKKKKWLN